MVQWSPVISMFFCLFVFLFCSFFFLGGGGGGGAGKRFEISGIQDTNGDRVGSCPFSISPPPPPTPLFLAVSPLKEPLQRRKI